MHLDLAAPELRLLRGGVNDEGQWADERDGELLAEGVVVDPGAEACSLIIIVLSVSLRFIFTLLKSHCTTVRRWLVVGYDVNSHVEGLPATLTLVTVTLVSVTI